LSRKSEAKENKVFHQVGVEEANIYFINPKKKLTTSSSFGEMETAWKELSASFDVLIAKIFLPAFLPPHKTQRNKHFICFVLFSSSVVGVSLR
jgi:hypothetical protein